jgi:hypothetical protein
MREYKEEEPVMKGGNMSIFKRCKKQKSRKEIRHEKINS